MADAALDRMEVEAKDRVDVPMGDTMIGLLSHKVKHAIHEKINDAGEEEAPEEEGQHAPPTEPPKEHKGGLSGLLEKLTRK